MARVFSYIVAISIGILTISSFTATPPFNSQIFPKAANNWQLQVSGLVNNPLDLSLADLAAMPETTVEATILCVDFPLKPVASGMWKGVRLSTLLDQAGIMSSAVKVAFFASDGYSTDLDLATAIYGNVVVAYEIDGAPLSENLRLVVPGKWGYKWISQLTSIALVDYDFKGKYESMGFSDDADIQSGAGAPNFQIPASPAFSNPSDSGQPTVPSPSPPASNSSTAVPSEETQPSNHEPEGSLSFSYEWVGVSVALVFVAAILLFWVRRHRRQTAAIVPAQTR